MIVSSKVPAARPVSPVLEYLAHRFTYLSREEWELRIAQGRILVNDETCTAQTAVHGGDSVAYDMPEFSEPPANLAFRIVYEDKWLLGIDKPANLLVHRSGRSFRTNLMYQLRHAHQPPYPSTHAISRLDRETSGLVCVAKDTQTLRSMHEAFEQRNVQKRYVAIVHGIPRPEQARIAAPIGRDTASSVKYRFCVNGEGAKEAVTDYRVIRTLADTFSELELVPHTGRTHQLRVHLLSIGHPIVGDKLYGAPEKDFLQWRSTGTPPPGLLHDRQALHCSRLEFTHPRTGAPCVIEAERPEDMRLLARRLRQNPNNL